MLRLYDPRTGRLGPVVPVGAPILRLRLHRAHADAAQRVEIRPLLLADLIRRTAERRLRVFAVADGPDGEEADLLALNIHPPQHPPPDAAGERFDLHIAGPGARQDEPPGRWADCAPLLFQGRPGTPPPAEVAAAGLDPLAVRLALLEHHYRRPGDLSWDDLRNADAALRRWRRRVAEWAQSPSRPIDAGHAARIQQALDDDVDTPLALRLLERLENDESVPPGSRFETFLYFDRVLGLDLPVDIGRI